MILEHSPARCGGTPQRMHCTWRCGIVSIICADMSGRGILKGLLRELVYWNMKRTKRREPYSSRPASDSEASRIFFRNSLDHPYTHLLWPEAE